MSKPHYRAASPTRRNGKTRWVTIGAGWEMTSSEGVPYISLKLDCLPTSPEWDGQINLFPYTGAEDDQPD